MYFMGIDIGTYESKGVITDEEACIVAYRACPHALESPKPGWVEHDAERTWWADLCSISNGLIADSGLNPKEIAALGVSTIAPCCLPVDAGMNPLRKAILYGIDVRAEKEIRQLEEELGRDYIFERYGMPLTTQSAGTKVLWIKHNEPEVYAKTAKFITGSTYLVAKLTGNYVIDRYTAAAWMPLYNVGKEDWEDDLLGICRPCQLAECRWTHEIAGLVTAEAARHTGLTIGTRVTVGTADASAEAVSVGAIEPGDMMLMYGSSIFIIHVVDKFTKDERLWAGPYLFPGTYSVTAGMSCAGTLTRWFRDNLAPDVVAEAEAAGVDGYSALAKLAAGVPAGSNGLIVLPYFSGERTPINDPAAKGVIFGLNLTHVRADLYNACLEGVGYGINQHFEIFDARALETRKVMAVGGGTKNRKWLQIVSDITGRRQQLALVETGAAYGDALLAALGVGRYNSKSELSKLIKMKESIEPDTARRATYAPLCERYAKLYEGTKSLMHEF